MGYGIVASPLYACLSLTSPRGPGRLSPVHPLSDRARFTAAWNMHFPTESVVPRWVQPVGHYTHFPIEPGFRPVAPVEPVRPF
jgi:hypothetical protein